MTDSEPTRHGRKHPDETDRDVEGSLDKDHAMPVEEAAGTPHGPAFDIHVVNDEKALIYEAFADDAEIAGLPYSVAGDDRLVLHATSVFPQYRKQGVATELIRRVLDDVRAQRKTVTVMCPIVRGFIERHPEYADLIDREHPGVAGGPHRA